MKKLLTISLILSFLLTNCITVLAEDTAEGQQRLEENECNIYIIRPKHRDRVLFPIYINGLLKTCLPSGTYACYNIRPGKTQIAYYNDAYSEIILDTFAGKSYYIKVQLKSPSIGNNLAAKGSPFVYGEFTIIDEVEGQKLLSECSVIDWSKDEGEKK